MKKTALLLLVICLIPHLRLQSQIEVNSNGNVLIGDNIFDGWLYSNIQARLVVTTSEAEPGLWVKTSHNFINGSALVSQVSQSSSLALSTLYIGTRTFYVRGNGEVYASGSYITSDISTKKNIENLTGALDKIRNIRGITFESTIGTDDQRASLTIDTLKSQVSSEVTSRMNAEKNRRRVGVIAQEVEAVLPEAVRTTVDGKKAVAYSELVALLIEAVKEQQQQIEQQQAQIEELKGEIILSPVLRSSEVSGTVLSTVSTEVKDSNTLYQNIPNPFTENTEIRYTISEKSRNCGLYIYDMQGRPVKNISGLDPGEGSVVINGSELKAGMYIYSLIVDGHEIDSKRMILTD